VKTPRMSACIYQTQCSNPWWYSAWPRGPWRRWLSHSAKAGFLSGCTVVLGIVAATEDMREVLCRGSIMVVLYYFK
jgi:hypothetical protein